MTNQIQYFAGQVAIILINLCVGPPLFRSAIFAAGEARSQTPAEAQSLPKADGSHQAL